MSSSECWINNTIEFDVNIYRSNSQDLRNTNLSDSELTAHFYSIGFSERRLYGVTSSKAEYFSNCYCRGLGIEIGAGANPVPMTGDARCDYGDIAEDVLFDDENVRLKKIVVNLNKRINSKSSLVNKYDFVIAQHVLEHCDSLAQALSVLSQLSKSGGIVYISLPIKDFDVDFLWMQEFGFVHHVIEYFSPSIFKKLHRNKYLKNVQKIHQQQGDAVFQGSSVVPGELYSQMIKGELASEYDYLYHRHSYSFEGWLKLLLKINKFFGLKLKLIDSGFGADRTDAHFIFEKSS
jgi:hypothetical protein